MSESGPPTFSPPPHRSPLLSLSLLGERGFTGRAEPGRQPAVLGTRSWLPTPPPRAPPSVFLHLFFPEWENNSNCNKSSVYRGLTMHQL